MPEIRTRFAPSPTGYLHIGGARTALFNYLYARHCGGKFVLRIEDTDRKRSTPEAIDAILRSMEWLQLEWDEGPFYQTERMDLYQERLRALLSAGDAYPCVCTAETLDAKRQAALEEKRKPMYDGTCRPAERAAVPLPEGVPFTIRFRSPESGKTVVDDQVKGRVEFDNAELDDLILARSDGSPTYNFCVVCDDIDMGISHIIRGDDHLSNTPRQMQLYQALGTEPPVFAHVPLILGTDKKRLSKRHGATSVMAYRDMGYFPEALNNYLVRLGWSHGDQEIFDSRELVEMFDIDAVGKSSAVFNPEKLLWLNAHYLKNRPLSRLAEDVGPYLTAKGYSVPEDRAWLERMVETLRERAKSLVELVDMAHYFLTEAVEIDEKAGAQTPGSRGQEPASGGVRQAGEPDRLQRGRHRAGVRRHRRGAGHQAGQGSPAGAGGAYRLDREPGNLRGYQRAGAGRDPGRGSRQESATSTPTCQPQAERPFWGSSGLPE